MGFKTSTSDFNDNNISVKNLNGTYMSYIGGKNSSPNLNYIYPYSYTGGMIQLTSGAMKLSSAYGVCFGSDDTPVTYDDYTLTALGIDFTINNFSAGTPTYDESNRTWSNIIEFDLTNTSSTDVDVKEVGIITGGSSGANYHSLIYREGLENPFTLQANQTVHYAHTIKFTMPEHS